MSHLMLCQDCGLVEPFNAAAHRGEVLCQCGGEFCGCDGCNNFARTLERAAMTKEDVYDTEINPLMVQIIEICNRHKIAMLASFHIPNHEDADLACTSFLLADDYDPPEKFLQAKRIIYTEPRAPMHYRIDNADGTVEMGAIL